MSLIIFACILIFVVYIVRINSGNFIKEKTYILTEIERSGSDNERKHWESMLVRLYLESIPIIGYFFS